MLPKKLVLFALLALLVASVGLPAGAEPSSGSSASDAAAEPTVTPLATSSFITFDEFPIGTFITNQYEPQGITFGGDSPFITSDSSNPTSPVLSGSPLFHGAIEGAFVVADVDSFSLDAGYFDDLASTHLTAYDVLGNLVADLYNSTFGIERFTVDAAESLASFRIEIATLESAGFAIDNLEIVIAEPPPLPAPVRYAPQVYLHPGEHEFPISAADFITDSRLRWSHDSGCKDHAVENDDGSDASYESIDHLRLGFASFADAYSHTANGSFCLHGSDVYLANQLTRPTEGNPERVTTGEEGMFLDLRNGARHGDSSLTAPVYYEYNPGRWIIYWMFYAYNDGVSKINHEGDWEHIVVRLDSNDQATDVAYFRHNCEPQIVSWLALQAGDGVNFGLAEGTHPIVYSAKGAHGSYPTPFSGVPCAFTQSDDATISDRIWQTWNVTLDAHTEPWYGFGGAWGEIGDTAGPLYGVTTGPLGPSQWKSPGAVPEGW
ncbi:MAG: hypothetical protein ACRDWA_08225 [Acidimicrobiia bacterium]